MSIEGAPSFRETAGRTQSWRWTRPPSHLDIANERRVTEALAAMPLTRIIVAHRPETIAGAQRVVGLRQGRVAEVARAPESLSIR